MIKILYKTTKSKKAFNEKKQNESFSLLGLDRGAALEKLSNLTNNLFGVDYNENRGMWSEHLVIFSAISLEKESTVNSILEIGTFKGETTLILSILFPKAKITSIDLSQDEMRELKEYSYATNNPKESLLESRNNLINKNKNIKFIEMDSLNLYSFKESFDLIWIDGAHGFPFVAIDITNALRMVNQNGIILCDDVYLNSKKQDSMTESTATWITLQKYQAASKIKVTLLLKRISQGDKKYIAFVKTQ